MSEWEGGGEGGRERGGGGGGGGAREEKRRDLINSFFLSDGQKIAKRLACQIAKESRNVKQLMDHYNACAVFSSSEQVSVSDVFDSTSNFWMVHSSLHMLRCAQGSVPLAAKHDMIRHFLLKKRSLEESELIQVEMANTLQYLYNIGMIFEHKIQELKDAEQTEFT